MTRAIKTNVEAVGQLFSILNEQGRMRKWLAKQIGISKTALWNYEHGIRTMPQAVYDRACEALNAPPAIANTKLPHNPPGRKAYTLAQKGA